MAYRIAAADGNWTTAATWGAVDATSLLDSQANNTALGTTDTVSTATFTPGAITIDGIALKVASRAASPSGTMTVSLFNTSTGATTTSVTINVSDLQLDTGSAASSTFDRCSIGWFFFKFQTSVTLTAGQSYRIRAKTSATSQVNLFRDATAGNWSRLLRTTTTGAPAAGDSMFVIPEASTAGSVTGRTVIYDGTGTTDYGGASTSLASIGIGSSCTLTYSTSASVTLNLRLSGVLQIWRGGTMSIGTPANPIPATSTATLEFDNAAIGDFGVVCYGTFHAQGVSGGRNRDYTFLSADIVTTNTVLPLEHDTGWLNGDSIVVAPSRRVKNEGEALTLSGAATATNCTVTAGVSYVHAGTGITRTEVINITRNVVLQVVNGLYGSYFDIPAASATGVVDLDWCRFSGFWGSSTSLKAGFYIGDGHTVTMDHVAWVNSNSAAGSSYDVIYFASAATRVSLTPTYTWSNLVQYSVGSPGWFIIPSGQANHRQTINLTDVASINSNNSGGYHFSFGSTPYDVTLTRVYISGGVDIGVNLLGTQDANNLWSSSFVWTDGHVHSLGTNTGLGIAVGTNGFKRIALSGVDFWRNASGGAGYGNVTLSGSNVIELTDCQFLGNQSANFGVAGNGYMKFICNSCNFGGESGYTSPSCVNSYQSQTTVVMVFNNCNIGVATGQFTTFTTADFDAGLGPNAQIRLQIYLNDSPCGSSTEFSANFLLACQGHESFIVRQRKDGTAATHERVYPRYATISYDTTTSRTAAPSEKITMATLGFASTSDPFESSPKYVTINSGSSVTITTYVLKNAAYTGNAPKLVMKANPALGFDSDVTIDTHAAAADVWDLLQGSTGTANDDGVLTFVVQLTGTAGSVWTDDWSAS